MAELAITLKGRVMQRVGISGVETVIGRDVLCDVVIDNPGVSRVHAKVMHDGNRFIAVDAGSANGMFVNGERMSRRVLRENDAISVGKFLVCYSAEGGADAAQLRQPEQERGMHPKLRKDLARTTNLSPKTMNRLLHAQHVAPAQVPDIDEVERLQAMRGRAEVMTRRARALGVATAGLTVAVTVLAVNAIWQIF